MYHHDQSPPFLAKLNLANQIGSKSTHRPSHTERGLSGKSPESGGDFIDLCEVPNHPLSTRPLPPPNIRLVQHSLNIRPFTYPTMKLCPLTTLPLPCSSLLTIAFFPCLNSTTSQLARSKFTRCTRDALLCLRNLTRLPAATMTRATLESKL